MNSSILPQSWAQEGGWNEPLGTQMQTQAVGNGPEHPERSVDQRQGMTTSALSSQPCQAQGSCSLCWPRSLGPSPPDSPSKSIFCHAVECNKWCTRHSPPRKSCFRHTLFFSLYSPPLFFSPTYITTLFYTQSSAQAPHV